jgi:hypothetical protein
VAIPNFISVDKENRDVLIQMSRSSFFINSTLKFELWSWLKGNPAPFSKFQFKVFIADKQQFGCPYYYGLVEPQIEDVRFPLVRQ